MPQTQNMQVVDEKTFAIPLVPALTILGSALVFVAGVTWKTTQTLVAIQGDISAIRLSLSDRWTASHQREWVHEMRNSNPTIKFTDPDEIRRKLTEVNKNP